MIKRLSEKMATEGGLAPSSDDMPVGGPKTPQQIAAQRRLQQTQAQVDEVVDIMKTNVEKVLERDQKLSELDDRADALQQGASQFEQQAGKLKSKFWLQNLKVTLDDDNRCCYWNHHIGFNHRSVNTRGGSAPRTIQHRHLGSGNIFFFFLH
ncbi:unnamed protein product, partial [Iphiclides podalirius]